MNKYHTLQDNYVILLWKKNFRKVNKRKCASNVKTTC